MNSHRPKQIPVAALVVLLTGCLLAGVLATAVSAGEAKGKMSKNFYRIPYGDGVRLQVVYDYIDHGNTPAGDTGKMDIIADAANQLLVAAADGIVDYVRDYGDDCGCDAQYGPCANVIIIRHANDEQTEYVHIKQHSALVSQGDTVAMGDAIAIEGDVGFTCSPDGRPPTADTCLASVPAGAGNCGRHLHWVVRRISTAELVNPMICSIFSNVFRDDGNYTAGICNSDGCDPNWVFDGTLVFDSLGFFAVYQAVDSIVTNGNFMIQNSASVVFHSGDRITLRPGFHARANGHFRAEIGPCSTTPNADEF
jgi:hypothetical protein